MRALALVAAFAGATMIPGGPPGVGVSIVALLIAATAAVPAIRTPDLVVFGVPALCLAAVPSALDAPWIVALDVAAAWVFATLAVGGVRLSAPVAPGFALTGAGEMLPQSSSRAVPPVRAVGIGVLVSIPFAALFLSADAAFAALADSTPRPQLGSVPGRVIAFVLVLLAAVGLALTAQRRRRTRTQSERTGLSRIEWVLPLALLDALFFAFVAVQVTVLFGGNEHVLRTAGLTYSEYARQGFWQLIAAAALTLAVVKGATAFARPQDRREQLLLRGLLAGLCASTIVIVASAVHRLLLYEDAFGLTRLRLAALAFSLWLGGVFALLLLLGALRRSSHFPRAAVAWAGLALIAFSVSNPDGRIAERNVERWRESGHIDLDYLSGLSADAVPALDELPAPLRQQALAGIEMRLAEAAPWSSANVSRARARRILDAYDSRSSRTNANRTPSTHSPWRSYAFRFTPSRTKPDRSAWRIARSLKP